MRVGQFPEKVDLVLESPFSVVFESLLLDKSLDCDEGVFLFVMGQVDAGEVALANFLYGFVVLVEIALFYFFDEKVFP